MSLEDMGVDHRCSGAVMDGHQGCGGDQRGDRRGEEANREGLWL